MSELTAGSPGEVGGDGNPEATRKARQLAEALAKALAEKLSPSESLSLSTPTADATQPEAPCFCLSAKYVDIVFPSRYVDATLPLKLTLCRNGEGQERWELALTEVGRILDLGPAHESESGASTRAAADSILSALRGR